MDLLGKAFYGSGYLPDTPGLCSRKQFGHDKQMKA